MKKILYTALAASLFAFSSCDDILDTSKKSSMEKTEVFSNEALVNDVVMGLHQSFGETNSYRGRYIAYFGVNSDCEIWNNTGKKGAFTDKEGALVTYNATTDNQYMNTDNNVWAKLYEAIERANSAITGMDEYSDMSSTNMRQFYGELLTLRAFIYFDLIKAFGDVPARFEPNTTETIDLPKTDRMVIMRRLLNDLLIAQDYVGWPNENSFTKSTERVSQTFTKGLRARIALFAAGYSQHPDGIRYNTEDATERQELYTIAKNECLDIISKGYNTLGTFEANFKALCAEGTIAGAESIFEIPFSASRGRVIYTWGVKHEKKDQWTKLAKGGINGPIPTLFYDYDVEDIRRDITCVPFKWTSDNDGDIAWKAPNKCWGGWSFGKVRFEWMNRVVDSSNDDGMNWQVMRMADIYLMAAEAINELEGPKGSSDAGKYLKAILDRSYPAEKASAILTKAKASQDAFFNVIVDERKFEFAGEAIRKVDLIRWNLLGSKMNEAKEKMTRLYNREGEYADLPLKIYYNEGLDGTDATSYKMYGLNHGDTDEIGQTLGYSKSKEWIVPKESADQAAVLLLIDQLYDNNPDTKQFWPIWKVFIDGSNGVLTNDYDY